MMQVDVKKGEPLPFEHGACAGKGVCGKCKIRVVAGRLPVVEAESRLLTKREQAGGIRLACCHGLSPEDLRIEVEEADASFQIVGNACRQYRSGGDTGFAVAVDIGTTTVALNVIHLQTGRVEKEALFLNPQRRFGADVLSRVDAARTVGLDALQKPLLACIERELRHVSNIKRMTVCGNPVMTHLFMGVDPASIGQAPYRCAVKTYRELDAGKLFEHLEGFVVQVLPPISGYVGSDVLMDLYETRLEDGLLVDLGTNGELALARNGQIWVSSAACGPAFEGGSLSCGSGACAGAVDQVWYEKGWRFHTIGGGEAKSVCGSGYISWLAAAVQEGFIDESGRLETDLTLNGEIRLTQNDVRAFQMAKGALAAAIEVLCVRAGTRVADLKTIQIAGGFGRHLAGDDLLALGFFSQASERALEMTGNVALQGAVRFAIKQDLETVENIVKTAEPVLMATDPLFLEAFVNHMGFGKSVHIDRNS